MSVQSAKKLLTGWQDGYSDCILLHYVRTISVQTMFYVGAWKEAHQRLRRTKIELVNEEEKNRPRTTEMFIFYSKFTLSFAFAHHFAFTFQPYTHKLHQLVICTSLLSFFISWMNRIEDDPELSVVLLKNSSELQPISEMFYSNPPWSTMTTTTATQLHNKVGLGMCAQTLTLKQYFTPKYRNLCK